MNTKTSKLLQGAKVYLRAASMEDLDDYYQLLCDPEGARLTGTKRTFSRSDAIRWLEKISQPQVDRWDRMIIEQQTHRFLGEVVLNDIDQDNLSANIRIGMNLNLPLHGKGFGTEALQLTLGYAFEELKLHRVSLGVYAFNERAIHVYEKLGFRKEGVLRDCLFDGERFHDEIIMSKLSTD